MTKFLQEAHAIISRVFGRKPVRKQRPRNNEFHRLCVEECERRIALDACGVVPVVEIDRGYVHEYPAWVSSANAGAQDVPVVSLDMYNLSARDALDSVSFRATGLDGMHLSDVASNFDLRADRDRDGVFETLVASARPFGDNIAFDNLSTVMGNDGLSLRVYADTTPIHRQISFGLDTSHMFFRDPNGAPLPEGSYSLVDVNASRVRIDPIVAQATLDIYVQGIGTMNTAVANESNLVGMRFEAHAGEQDVLLTQFVAGVTAGHVNTRDLFLTVDSDGNGLQDLVLQSDGRVDANGNLVFDNIAYGGYLLEAETSVTFEVHFAVASSIDPSLTLSMSGVSAEAEEVSTGASLQKVTVHDTTPLKWSFAHQGDLFVRKSVDPIPSRQLLGGMLSAPIMMIDFAANVETVGVTKLAFQAIGSQARSVDRLELFLLGSNTPFATATIAGTGSDPVPPGSSVFTAKLQPYQLAMLEGEGQTVVVRARMKTDDQGGMSGETIQFELIKVEARGDTSSNDLLSNDGDAVAEGEVFMGTDRPGVNVRMISSQHVVVMSKVTAIVNASPDADGTQLVSSGIQPIGQLRFTAATNTNTMNGLNRVAFDAFLFTLQVSNVTADASSFRLYNKVDSSLQVQGVLMDSSGNTVNGNAPLNGTYYVGFQGLNQSVIQNRVGPGQSATFVVSANLLSTNDNSFLELSLDSFSNPLSSSFGIDGSHVKWYDMDVLSTLFFGIDYNDTVVKSTKYYKKK